MLNAAQIIDTAYKIGFDICGIAPVHTLENDKNYTLRWLEEGLDGGLTYLHRNIDKRFSPALLFEGAKSVIVCGVNYRNRFSLGYPADFEGAKIASYALAPDYHRIIGDKLHLLAKELGITQYKTTVDTAPNAEKRWAVEAGLGQIGRNKLLITPRFGAFVMLGTLIVCDEVDEYATPIDGNPCGECHRCWDNCPSGALGKAGIDARKCISRQTIEKDADPNVDTYGWKFGCDECQSCCPYNKRASIQNTTPTLAPLFDPTTITDEELSAIIPLTAMKRRG